MDVFLNAAKDGIDDSIILATDEAGDELLRFALNVGGKAVLLRYPVWGQWNDYCLRVSNLFNRLSKTASNLDLPDSVTGILKKDRFPNYMLLTSYLLADKQVAEEIENIYFDFLKPELAYLRLVENTSDEKLTRKWMRENAPIDITVRLLNALLVPQEMLKKNVRYGMTLLSQDSQAQPSPNKSQANGDGQNSNSGNAAFSGFS